MATETPSSHQVNEEKPFPERIGRYQVRQRLGGGGFGNVYRCYDALAEREVAIKVPHRNRFTNEAAKEAMLREARRVGRLRHSGIVQLLDVGENDTEIFLIYQFIEGMSLFELMRQGPLWHDQVVLLVAQVAEALHYAHSQEVFHRDIKPGNILIDTKGTPYITDFGLAIREDELVGERGLVSGTLPYMPPEQARGEGHRVDGRTDIYSLGVVLYEALCQRRPFRGNAREVMDQILHREPPPPRQIVDTIDPELERICLKAMAKQMNARYLTAGDMAKDLRLAVDGNRRQAAPEPETVDVRPSVAPPTPVQAPSVLPKGLRSFGPEDSDFFLDLLPGPRDRERLPESIRFWKARIESRDPDAAFAVGLVYGPSGCGKSSLVKAGLLPRLHWDVVPIYVEATRESTETRLEKALHRAFPILNSDLSVAEKLAVLRRGQDLSINKKLLIVFDQFEQWLHAFGQNMENSNLVAALRQADGVHIQFILMVRDDFWMSVSRLFEFLEINLDRAANSRAVDLFDIDHARRVLRLFGQAFERLPPEPKNLTPDQEAFLDRAVAELNQDGRIIPVRLSLFADLMKVRPWTSTALIEVGGAEGVGVRFLEETFSGRAALPDLRAMEKHVRALLQALLPESGTDIKGRMRSGKELATASGLADQSGRFKRLMDLLDRELHIITPTEAEINAEKDSGAKHKPLADNPESESTVVRLGAFYQLTHDYLVPSLREWLTHERRKTWRGRAELCLEERTAQWLRSQDQRFLPSAPELFVILLGVPSRKCTADQRALRRASATYYTTHWGTWLLLLLACALAIGKYSSSISRTAKQERAEAHVSSLISTSPERVPVELEKLAAVREYALPLLRARFDDDSNDANKYDERLRAAFALASLDRVDHHFLVQAVAQAPALECKNLITALVPVLGLAKEELHARTLDASNKPETRARYAVVLLHLGDADPAQAILSLQADPTLRTSFVLNYRIWHGGLRQLAEILNDAQDSALRSGLCSALGLIDPLSVEREAFRELTQVLSSLYENAPDSATHGAAAFALHKWKVTGLRGEPTARRNTGRQWFVNGQGMKMVRIVGSPFIMGDASDDKAPVHEVDLHHAYYLGDQKISVRLFRRFLDDPTYDGEKPEPWSKADAAFNLQDDCPVQKVNWNDVILFCNWLSRKEDLMPCYKKTKDGWYWLPDSNGYRLPTEAEWEFACRAGTTTKYSFGDDPALLTEFAVFREMHTFPEESRIPNGWGLFGMHGNVSEWCWDRYYDVPVHGIDREGSSVGVAHVLRGGFYLNFALGCTSGKRTHLNNATLRTEGAGIRVAADARPAHAE